MPLISTLPGDVLLFAATADAGIARRALDGVLSGSTAVGGSSPANFGSAPLTTTLATSSAAAFASAERSRLHARMPVKARCKAGGGAVLWKIGPNMGAADIRDLGEHWWTVPG